MEEEQNHYFEQNELEGQQEQHYLQPHHVMTDEDEANYEEAMLLASQE